MKKGFITKKVIDTVRMPEKIPSQWIDKGR